MLFMHGILEIGSIITSAMDLDLIILPTLIALVLLMPQIWILTKETTAYWNLVQIVGDIKLKTSFLRNLITEKSWGLKVVLLVPLPTLNLLLIKKRHPVSNGLIGGDCKSRHDPLSPAPVCGGEWNHNGLFKSWFGRSMANLANLTHDPRFLTPPSRSNLIVGRPAFANERGIPLEWTRYGIWSPNSNPFHWIKKTPMSGKRG